MARDLDRALRGSKIEGPFVVVGHSAGALYVRLFANRRPREIVGMVLVEPSVEHQDRRFAGLLGPGAGSLEGMRSRALRCQHAAEGGKLPSADPDLVRCGGSSNENQPESVNTARRAEALRPTTWSTQVSELDSLWGRTSDQVSMSRQSYGATPLVVLTAGDAFGSAPEPARTAIRTLWSDLHREIAMRSARGEVRLIEGSGHMMIFDKPEAIVAAVNDVVAGRVGRAGTPQ